MQYQVQEMLRAERIFEAAGIAEELAAYNPLIPDGRNLKATMLIEYPDAGRAAHARSRELQGHRGRCWLQVAGLARVYRRSPTRTWSARTTTKTSAVHFLRFELDAADESRR